MAAAAADDDRPGVIDSGAPYVYGKRDASDEVALWTTLGWGCLQSAGKTALSADPHFRTTSRGSRLPIFLYRPRGSIGTLAPWRRRPAHSQVERRPVDRSVVTGAIFRSAQSTWAHDGSCGNVIDDPGTLRAMLPAHRAYEPPARGALSVRLACGEAGGGPSRDWPLRRLTGREIGEAEADQLVRPQLTGGPLKWQLSRGARPARLRLIEIVADIEDQDCGRRWRSTGSPMSTAGEHDRDAVS